MMRGQMHQGGSKCVDGINMAALFLCLLVSNQNNNGQINEKLTVLACGTNPCDLAIGWLLTLTVVVGYNENQLHPIVKHIIIVYCDVQPICIYQLGKANGSCIWIL